jgi:hypothetical protein
MNAFLVDLKNKPGALADAAEAIAAKGVNILGVSGTACGDGGRVAIMTADDATARAALKERNITFKEMEATEVSLRHEPGTLAQAARRLAQAGVNIEAIFPTGMEGSEVSVAFVTDQPAKAKESLAMVGGIRR